MTIIAKGAEATIFLEKGKIIKHRIAKGYRHPAIDSSLRKSRTRKEAKLLEKAQKIISVPKLLKQEVFSIEIEYIDGDKLSEKLSSYPIKKQLGIMKQLGEEVSKLHEHDLIHGDLTTSNTILKDNKVYIIDFGLGFISKKIEDKAVDLHLIRQALEAKHFQNFQDLYQSFLQGYKWPRSDEVLERLKQVESRGRNKH